MAKKAKDEILTAIRTNLAKSDTSLPSHVEQNFEQWVGSTQRSITVTTTPANGGRNRLVETFCENLVGVGGNYSIVQSVSEASAALQKIIDDLGPIRIAVSDSQWARAVLDPIETDAEILDEASPADLFRCDIGITEAQWAIAETGTVVLDSAKERNRLVSLVPEVHICLLRREKILETMAEVFGILKPDLSPVVTFATGPSRTSDIELTLAIGVHGPREVCVIVVSEENVSGESKDVA